MPPANRYTRAVSLWVHMVRMELVRVLREANTILYLGFPLVAYPLMIWGSTQTLQYLGELREREPLRVAVSGPVAELDLGGEPLVRASGGLADLDEGRLDAVVEGSATEPVIHHRSGSVRSQRARKLVVERLEEAAEARLLADVTARGALPAEARPIRLETESTDAAVDLLRWVLAVLCSTVFPAALTLGALSPCSELFVAERERHSLETTLTAAVSREKLVLARLAAGALLGALAAVANVGALALTLTHGALLLDAADGVPLPSPGGMLAIAALAASGSVLVTVLFSFAFSFARTFREAQSIASPVLMALVLPSLVGTLGLVGGWADQLWWIPVVHTGTLVAGAINGTAVGWQVALAAAGDLVLAGCLLGGWFATWGADALLVGVSRPSWLIRLIGEST
jgi:hypothetical protein